MDTNGSRQGRVCVRNILVASNQGAGFLKQGEIACPESPDGIMRRVDLEMVKRGCAASADLRLDSEGYLARAVGHVREGGGKGRSK
jgi:hypothetical protein